MLCCCSKYSIATGLEHLHSLWHILQVGMVIDLTNSSRYYEFDEATGTSEFRYPGSDAPQVFHRKVVHISCSTMCVCTLVLCACEGLPQAKTATPLVHVCRYAARAVVKHHSRMRSTSSAGPCVCIICTASKQIPYHGQLCIALTASIAQVRPA